MLQNERSVCFAAVAVASETENAILLIHLSELLKRFFVCLGLVPLLTNLSFSCDSTRMELLELLGLLQIHQQEASCCSLFAKLAVRI